MIEREDPVWKRKNCVQDYVLKAQEADGQQEAESDWQEHEIGQSRVMQSIPKRFLAFIYAEVS